MASQCQYLLQPLNFHNYSNKTQPGNGWPRGADNCLKTFMHEKNFYQYDMADVKDLDLVQQLRKGTELEKIGMDASDYNKFVKRIRARVKMLSATLAQKGLVVDGRRTRHFTELWDAREQIWSEELARSKELARLEELKVSEELAMSEVISTPIDIYEVPTSDDDNRSISTPSKSQRPKMILRLSTKRKVSTASIDYCASS
jgi:hypothetical protein